MSFEPPSINPYEVLGVDEKATADAIKSAYRKKALKHHPDKAPAESREEANQHFQEIAFAYAILSDERRRRRYDATGNTSETLDLDDDDDDFNWTDFYREQFAGVVDTSAIDKIKKEYQQSAEERDDLLAAFEQHKGDLDRVYDAVMLSNVLDDDARFRATIDQAIADGTVQAWPKYTDESERKRQKRLKHAQREAAEAEAAAQELETKASSKGRKKKAKGDDNELAALIQQRQKSRAAGFLDSLEAKYTDKGTKRAAADEPPEEAFAAVGARRKPSKGRAKRSRA